MLRHIIAPVLIALSPGEQNAEDFGEALATAAVEAIGQAVVAVADAVGLTGDDNNDAGDD